MEFIISWLHYIFIDRLGTPLVYHILLVTVLAFFGTRFAFRTIPGLAERIGRIISQEQGPYQQYLTLLEYFLDRFAVVFYSRSAGQRKLRPRPLIQIYSTFLAIALGYTVVLFFIGWATGGSGAIGKVRIIVPDYLLLTRLVIAVGWAILGYLVWLSVRDHQAFTSTTAKVLARVGVGVQPELAFALTGSVMVFLSQWTSQDRTFALSSDVILLVQVVLAAAAFLAIYWNKRSAVGFTHVATACYGLSIGVPVLIGVPIAVAIVTALAGNGPLLVSTTLVPLFMLAYYYVLPGTFQVMEFSNLVLAAIACLPLLLAVFAISYKDTSLPRAIVYSTVSFLPFWIPVSFSSYQISDPVAFAVVIFWFVVPVLNGVWDSISWWLTWTLLSNLRDALRGIEEPETSSFFSLSRWVATGKRFATLAGHIAANLVISMVLFLVTFFVLLATLELVNGLVRSTHPEYMIDVVKLLESVRDDPYTGDGLWIMTMVFVTLVPALFHLFFVLVATFLSAISPRLVARSWAELGRGLQNISHEAANKAINTVAVYLALSVLFASTFFLGMWSIYWRFAANHQIGDVLGWIGQWAIDAALALQRLVS